MPARLPLREALRGRARDVVVAELSQSTGTEAIATAVANIEHHERVAAVHC